jgi:hypothetical protein
MGERYLSYKVASPVCPTFFWLGRATYNKDVLVFTDPNSLKKWLATSDLHFAWQITESTVTEVATRLVELKSD